MRKFISQFSFITIAFIAVGLFLVPYAAHANAIDGALSLLTGGSDLFYGLIGKVFWWLLIPLAGFVLSALGLVIDGAVALSLNPSFYNSESISIAWSIVRDLANMFFIFVLIYEGIRTILNIGNMASVKKTIAGVIFAALLLNFSLFFTKALIDVSNVATSFFTQGITNIAGKDNTSISSSVRAVLQMEKLTKTSGGNIASASEAKSLSLQSFTQGVLLFVVICVAIYVFFQIIFLIIGRIVAFIFLLITAPIGFIGKFLPLGDISKQADKWWTELTNQLIMLPMFFLMLYLTLFMVDRFDNTLFASASASTEFTPINYMIFILIIMMLLKALSVAKEYSGEIGKMVTNVTKAGVGLATGTVAMGTIGKAADALQNNKGFQKWSANSGAVGRMTLKATSGTASAGFGVKSGIKGLGLDKAPIVGGQFNGADKGYSGKIEQEIKNDEEYAKLLGDKDTVEGAENRQAYAKYGRMGLVDKVKTNAVATGQAIGAVADASVNAAKVVGTTAAGAMAGSVAGPVGAVVGGIAGANSTKTGRGSMEAFVEDRGQKESSEKIGKAADKELEKAEGIQATKDDKKDDEKIAEHNKDLAYLTNDLENKLKGESSDTIELVEAVEKTIDDSQKKMENAISEIIKLKEKRSKATSLFETKPIDVDIGKAADSAEKGRQDMNQILNTLDSMNRPDIKNILDKRAVNNSKIFEATLRKDGRKDKIKALKKIKDDERDKDLATVAKNTSKEANKPKEDKSTPKP